MNLFTSWDSLLRILTTGFFSYVALVLMLKISGSRTLSKMNSFDFIVTIAMGSTLSSALLQKSVSIADSVFALGLLIVLQYLITRFSVESKAVNQFFKSEPQLLFLNGMFLRDSMHKERVTTEEILAAMREESINNLDEVEAVILETNGKLSAIKKSNSVNEDTKTYKDVSDYQRSFYESEFRQSPDA